MKIKGWDLDFFNSGEWQVIDERLKDLEKIHRPVSDGYNPGRKMLFEALRSTPYEEVRVAIIGQDPYPDSRLATGLAFGVPEGQQFPPTLRTIFKEYERDLHYPCPSSGDLKGWANNGVLLWNAVPSCGTGKSLSHDWTEWDYLTREIVTKLAKKGIVYALLGQVARRYSNLINCTNNRVVLTSHPSPRGSLSSRTPFNSSRLFSTINAHLNDLALEPIEWRLE